MSTAQKPIHPLLAKYLTQLALNPLRTKALTTATLCFLQEVLGNNLSGTPAQQVSKNASPLTKLLAKYHVNSKALKLAFYGFFISAPLSHYLIGALQKAFEGKTSTGAKVAQILANSLLIAPIQTTSYLSSMAVISGASSVEDVVKTVKAGFFSVIRISWVVSPISIAFAQKFIPVELWVPFFNALQFILGTWFNIRVKKMQLAAARKKQQEEGKDKK